MDDWRIRLGRPEDHDEWRAVYEQVALEGRWIGGEQPLPPGRSARFDAFFQDDRLLLVVEQAGGGLVGSLFSEFTFPGVTHLGMQLLEAWRGRGIGSALMEKCIDWTRDKRAHKVVLDVWPHNDRAIALYGKFGFEVEGRHRRHWRRTTGELWDMVAMGLVLDDESAGSPHPDAPNLPTGPDFGT